MNELKAPSLQSLLESERGSTDSLLAESLNIEDLDDIEFSIPPTETLPTLESVLNAFEDDSDVISELGIPNATPTPSIADESAAPTRNESRNCTVASIMRYTPLHGVAAQLASAAECVNAGTATACAISASIAIGTSHGHLLNFDVTQTLRWTHQDKTGQGALSSLAFNTDCSRLLAGYSRGLVVMFDCQTGNPLRNITDAVTPNSGVLHVKWTSRASLALCADTGGSVWALSFTRKLGIRGHNSRCLFSGARGEVCAVEPLLMHNQRRHELDQYCIVALATLSKVFVVTIRPRLRVLKYHMLQGPPDSLPLLAWQWVLIQAPDSSFAVDPVLVVGRGNQLFFHQLFVSGGRITLFYLRHVQHHMNFLTNHWLGTKYVAALDTSEILHLIDMRTSKELECVDMAHAGVVYGSAQFKGLATGGNVSPAFALAGTNACYNSVVAHGAQLYILGARSLHVISVRTLSERISYLIRNQRWLEACHLALDGYLVSVDKPRRCLHAKERILTLCKEYASASAHAPEYCLGDVIKCIVTIGEPNLLWDELWPNLQNKDLFLQHISAYIESEQIHELNPIVSQALVDYWLHQSPARLEQLILKLDWTCLDLNQVLRAVKKHELYRAQLYLGAKALSDYTGALVELIPRINNSVDTELGNCLLVYISSCLAGRSYPSGEIPLQQAAQVKHEVLRCLISPNSKDGGENSTPKYPYLHALLKFDTRETLNVISLAFQEQEFNNESGNAQKKRIVNILLEIMAPTDEPAWPEIGCLLNFIAQQISMQNLPAEEELLSRVLNYLSQAHVEDESVRQHSEREGAWHELLNNNCLAEISTDEEQLRLAEQARCYYVVEHLLEKLQRYDNVVECYTQSPQRHDTLYAYLERHVEQPERKIYEQLRRHLATLLEINTKETARIVALHYLQCLDELLASLAVDDHKVFLLLRSLADRGLHLSSKHMDLLVDLYCKHECATAILAFLETSNGYRHAYALQVAQRYNLPHVIVYLAEQLENYKLAFECSMDILRDSSENEEAATLQAKKLSSLLARAAKVMPVAELESCWFTLLTYILPRPELRPITKSMLHDASQHIDLHNLVQLVLNTKNVSGNFGDIKHLIMSMLTNSRQQTEALRVAAQSNELALHHKFAQKRREACRGLWVTMLHCAVCQARLSGQPDASSIIVLGPCGHVLHEECLNSYAQDVPDDDDKTNMRCPRCLQPLAERVVKQPLTLCQPSHASDAKKTQASYEAPRPLGVLQLKAPPRKFC